MLKSLVAKKLVVGPSHDYGGPSLNELKKEGIAAVIDLNQDLREMSEASEIGVLYVNDSELRILDNCEPIPINTLICNIENTPTNFKAPLCIPSLFCSVWQVTYNCCCLSHLPRERED